MYDQTAKYMDHYEQALYNHILASVAEDNPGNTYHVPLNPGAQKRFSNADMSGFTCCNGTALESNTKLQDTIYFKSVDNRTLYVNLYIPSTVNWSERKVSVQQTTDFPYADTTRLVVKDGGTFDIGLQALSGAGYPGVPSLDSVGNVIPYIAGEEEKIEQELCKLLGDVEDDGIRPAPITVSRRPARVTAWVTSTSTDLHDLRSVKFSPEGEGLWRRAHSMKRNGNLYPTHGLGPVANCMDINRGDRFASLVSMSGPSRGLQLYAREHFSDGSPQRREQYVLGDVNVSLIRTATGRTICVSHDTNLPRPYSRVHVVQGTRGLFQGYPDRVYIEGRSKPHEWDAAETYLAQFDHPLWQQMEAKSRGAGHGGMDFLEDYRLIKCLREGVPTDMNVYDAAALSVVTPLSVGRKASLQAIDQAARHEAPIGILTQMEATVDEPKPEQLFGIEINPYAYELAQATIWIGYIQWLHENGYGIPSEPILRPLHNILNMDAILAYDWPGNVRELENALEHAVTMSRGAEIVAGELPERISSPRRPIVQEPPHANPTLDAIEQAYILWVLQQEGGNKTRAAEILGAARVEFLDYHDSGMAGEPFERMARRPPPDFSAFRTEGTSG